MNFENYRFVNLTPREESVLRLGCNKPCSSYSSLINRLLNLKAVIRAVKLRVAVKRGTYPAICNNYRIIEHNLQN